MLKNHKYQKINSKMLLHKKGKNWIVLSIGILAMVLGGFSLKENNVHANINQPQQQVQTRTVSSQANNLHKTLINNATKQQLNHNHNLNQRPIKQDQSNHTMKLGASQSSILANNARNQYNYLKQYENSDNPVFLSKPYSDDTGRQISDGKINPTYTQHIVDWMNYIRGLYNISPISHSTDLDKIAQSVAVNQDSDNTTLINNGEFEISTADNGEYQTESCDTSDESSSTSPFTPSNLVMTLFNTDRLWLLDPEITTIGVGYNDMYNGSFQFIYNRTPMPNKNEIYATPAINLSPYKISSDLTMKDAYWSIALPDSIVKDPDEIDFSKAPTIYDDTAHKKVPLNIIPPTSLRIKINLSNAYYASFEVHPNKAYIKPNHVYTITWYSKYPKGIIKYRTKLYSTYSYKTSRVNKPRTRRHRTRVVKNKRHHVHNNRRHRRTHRIRTHRHHRRFTKRHTRRNRKNRHKSKRNTRHHRHHRRH